MGVLNSKTDVVCPMEISVGELLDKFSDISQQRGLVNIILKEAILKALNVYAGQIMKSAYCGQIPYQKAVEIRCLINEAIKKLECLPTCQSESQTSADVRNDPEAITTHLYEIERKMNFREIAAHEYKNTLNTVIFYYQQFDALSQSIKFNHRSKQDLKNEISALILELFVKLPRGDMSDQVVKNPVEVLKETAKNMKSLDEMLKTLDITKLTISDSEQMTDILENISLMAISINHKSNLHIKNLRQMDFEGAEVECKNPHDDQKVEDGNGENDNHAAKERSQQSRTDQQNLKYKNHLKQMEKALQGYENEIQQFTSITEKHVIFQNMKKIRQFSKELQAVPGENQENLKIITYLFNRTVKLNKILEKIDHEQQIAQYKDRLHHMEKALQGFENCVQQILLPIEKLLINLKLKEIQDFVMELQAVPDVHEEILGIKQYLSDRAVSVNKTLEQCEEENNNIINYMEKVNKVEREVREVVESNISLQDKLKFLKKQMETVKLTDSPNHEEVMRIKVNALNRMEGLSIAETINYLNQIKKTLNHHRMHALQFAYPKRNSEYGAKRNEIVRLSEDLKNVPTGDQCVDSSVQTIRNKIDEVLQILDKKASDNDSIIGRLEYLDKIDTQIIYTNGLSVSFQTKLESFNEFRERINLIPNVSHRIISKKCQVYFTIHNYEESVYSSGSIKVKNLKKTLDQYENYVQQFSYSINSDDYRQKRDEIKNLLEDVKMISVECPSFYEIKQQMCHTVSTVLTALEKNCKYNEEINQCLQSLKIRNSAINNVLGFVHMKPEKKLELLAQYRSLMHFMTSVTKAEVVNQMMKVNQYINIAESIIRLEFVRENLAQHKEFINKHSTSPLESSVYKEKINSIIHLKDYIEDMAEGNPDLDRNKQMLLNDINQVLKNLDEYVAQILFKKKSTENILDLQRHFDDFNTKTLNIPKESIEFVTIIKSRAEHLEEKVKHYLGKSDSVDYYVIHENLVRLLEELDQLTCQGDKELLTATVSSMDYIKRLMEQLDANVAAN